MNLHTPDEEPTFEEISDLLRGELDEVRAEAVRDFLANDPELARAALDLVDPSGLAEVANLDATDVNRAWARFALRPESGAETAHTLSREKVKKPWFDRFFSRRPVWAMASAFLMGFMLSSALYLRTSAPRGLGQGRLVVERLEREGTPIATRGKERRIELGEGVESLVLLLSPPSSLSIKVPQQARYTVSRGEEVLISGEVWQQDEGFFALSLPSTSLPPGDYRIQLFSPDSKDPFVQYGLLLSNESSS